jgi:hypothetical protein
MRKITILLGENSSYSMDLDDQVAIETYTDLIGYLMKKSAQSINISNSSVNEKIESVNLIDAASEINKDASTPVAKNEVTEKLEKEEVTPSITGNPFSENHSYAYKKLIAYRCPDCNKITVRFMVLAESNVTHCHFCRRKEIVIESVRLASFTCEACGVEGYAHMANGLTEITCKECDAPIDLFDDTKDGYNLKSMNMILSNSTYNKKLSPKKDKGFKIVNKKSPFKERGL